MAWDEIMYMDQGQVFRCYPLPADRVRSSPLAESLRPLNPQIQCGNFFFCWLLVTSVHTPVVSPTPIPLYSTAAEPVTKIHPLSWLQSDLLQPDSSAVMFLLLIFSLPSLHSRLPLLKKLDSPPWLRGERYEQTRFLSLACPEGNKNQPS